MESTNHPSHYEVLQAVLSQTRDVICNVCNLSKEEAFQKAQEFIKDNSRRWKLVNPNINYSDPFCRMAYLYMNVAIHANLVEKAISSFSVVAETIKSKIISGKEIRVCALGGGPGSELLGIVRLIENLQLKGHTAYLDFLLVDQIKEWDESWHAIKSGVDAQLMQKYGSNRSNWPVIISRSFLPLNATSPSDFINFATRFSSIDLFLVCYLVSEVQSFIENFKQVLNILITRSSPDALLLFIDRDEKRVRDIVSSVISDVSELEIIGNVRDRGRMHEDPADLGEWYMNIESLPRRDWLVFFILARRLSLLK